MRALPGAIAAADPPVIRPRDVAHVYAQPPKELRDLAQRGSLLRVAHGYYVVVPEGVRHVGGWVPTVEGLALAIALRDYGPDVVALMGMSAARLLGALPRALGAAVVAVPKQRAALKTTAGRIVFVRRDVERLATRRITTDLAEGWVTTVEQAALDLEDRPSLGDFPIGDVREAAADLARRADPETVRRLGAQQRKRKATDHLVDLMGNR